MINLQRANDIRLGIADVKREVGDGALSVADALADLRAQPMRFSALLASQDRWGPTRSRVFCRELPCSELRKVRDLTDREKREIARRLGQEYPLDGTESSTEKAA